MQEIPTKHMSCNICGKDDTKNLFKKEVRGALFHYVQCKNCGLVYVDPMPDFTPEELDRYYSSEYYSKDRGSIKRGKIELENPEDPRVRANVAQLKVIESRVDKGRLVDIGCGAGFFLKSATKRGWDACGVEPSRRAAEYAKKEVGVRVYTGDLESVNLTESGFDVATLRHVLEHSPDPSGLLLEVNRILKNGGLVVIHVPNVDTITRKMKNAYYLIFSKKNWSGTLDPPTRNYEFSSKTLKMIVEKAGFSVYDCTTYPFGDSTYWPTDPFQGKKFPKKVLLKLMRFLEIKTGKNKFILLYAKKSRPHKQSNPSPQ